MSGADRRRWRYPVLIALVLLAVVALAFTILSRNYFRQRAAWARHEAAVEAVRQQGGLVVLGPETTSGLPPEVVRVDGSRARVDAGLMRTLGQFTGLERLELDGAQLQPQDWALLGKLPRLQRLSLDRSNITDASISGLPRSLARLSLQGTAVTDKGLPWVAAMHSLVSLDITETKVTSDGLRLLEPLTSLETLRIDESCLTAASVESLQRMQPKRVEVEVLDGWGRTTYELLTGCRGPLIKGLDRNQYVLWTADSPWNHTLAGVVEAVAARLELDPPQTARLLEILGEEPPEEGWGPIMALPSYKGSSVVPVPPDRGTDLATVEAFLRELNRPTIGSATKGVISDRDRGAVRRYVREKFSARDVPALLAALRAAPYSRDNDLFRFGPFLLAQQGIDEPEVRAELDRLLTHQEGSVRYCAITAFGFFGARDFYTRDEWTPNAAADAFAVPRLVRLCQDNSESEGLREDASRVLAEIAGRRPEHAAEVLTVLVDLLNQEGPWHLTSTRPLTQVDIPRLAKLDPQAALAQVPRLRALLKKLDNELAGAPATSLQDPRSPAGLMHRRRISVLGALAAIAHHDPALAYEIAQEYLRRLAEGQPVGPLTALVSPDAPAANRLVVLALLDNPDLAKGELAVIAKQVRDGSTIRPSADE
jgi:hypothetical protein